MQVEIVRIIRETKDMQIECAKLMKEAIQAMADLSARINGWKQKD